MRILESSVCPPGRKILPSDAGYAALYGGVYLRRLALDLEVGLFHPHAQKKVGKCRPRLLLEAPAQMNVIDVVLLRYLHEVYVVHVVGLYQPYDLRDEVRRGE